MRSIFQTIYLALLFSLLSTAAISQTDASEPGPGGFETVLHVVHGSDRPGTAAQRIPTNIQSLVKTLSSDFAHTNQQLVATYLGRVAGNGSVVYKSIINLAGAGSDAAEHGFIDWRVDQIRRQGAGDAPIEIRAFQFGARVPVRLAGTPTTNYELVSVALNSTSVQENTPTVLGTLSLPGGGGTLFVVLTVRQIN